MAYVTRPQRRALGDITCWGIDVDKWQQDNTIPVFDNKWNTWVVQIRGESMSDAQAIDVATRVIKNKWFNERVGEDLGRADPIEATIVKFEDLGSIGKLNKQWTDTKPQIQWLPSQSTKLVKVRFVYRGSRPTIPWPVFSGDAFGPYCPKNVRAGVTHVYYADEGPDVPPVPPEDPCNIPGAKVRDPRCRPNPGDVLKSLPWWVWALGAVVVAPYAWPIIAPAVSSWGRAAGRAVKKSAARRASRKAEGGE